MIRLNANGIEIPQAEFAASRAIRVRNHQRLLATKYRTKRTGVAGSGGAPAAR
jgi:hypothetical protein